MTEKRYKSIGANLECSNGMEYMLIKRNDGFNVCQVCSKHTAKEIVDELNSLADENEQLKQFQDRVFSWIDMHLQRLPTLRDDEFESDNEFADPSLYSGAIQILETMKRELKGDD